MQRFAPRAITFDAAGTLVDVRYEPVPFMLDLLGRSGVEVDEDALRRAYVPMRAARQEAYATAVQSYGAHGRRRFWHEFTSDLLQTLDVSVSDHLVGEMVDRSEDLLFGDGSPYWRLYPDVLEALSRLRQRGVRLAVVSNWDDTIHPVLELLGIRDRFEFVLASLEVGWEKPDPRIFGRAVARLGLEPFEVVHVGDHPVDDGEGAATAGLFPILIDREGVCGNEPFSRIRALVELLLLYE